LLAHLAAMAGIVASPLVVALLLGLVIAQFGTLPGLVRPGLAFACRPLLRFAIVLLGLRIGLPQIAEIGVRGITSVAALVIGTLASGYWISRRLGLSKNLAWLLASGHAICGAAAIMATDSVLKAKEREVSQALTLVTLFGTVTMLVCPLLGKALELSTSTYGFWVGGSIHEVAQAVAAGFALGDATRRSSEPREDGARGVPAAARLVSGHRSGATQRWQRTPHRRAMVCRRVRRRGRDRCDRLGPGNPRERAAQRVHDRHDHRDGGAWSAEFAARPCHGWRAAAHRGWHYHARHQRPCLRARATRRWLIGAIRPHAAAGSWRPRSRPTRLRTSRTGPTVMTHRLLPAAATLLLFCAPALAQDIAYEKFTLPNGMTVILHEDHSLPQVVINTWFRVGSQGRATRPQWLRAPVRTPDVHGHRARAGQRL
jgi:hypothetical protein